MKTNVKTMLLMIISTLLILLIGLSYAFFTLEIEGTGKDVIVSAGNLRLEYKDEAELKFDNAFPGDSITKVITVKNTGTLDASYSLYWKDLINTIENFELHVRLNCKSYVNYGESTQTESGTCDNIYRAVPISSTKTSGNIKKGISIEPGVAQEYTVTVTFDNKNYLQDNNKNKNFTGKIGIEEYQAPKPAYCTFDGDMVQGVEYVNGQYTYRYMQEGTSASSGLSWKNITADGWGVQLTDKTSTIPVTSELCTYINNKPVVSMSSMFYSSQATTLDLSSFDTSNVTNMNYMFYSSQAITLDLSSFDTSKVTDMSNMFDSSQAITLDLSNFDTSNVTNMNSMFYNCNNLKTIYASSKFVTNNVTSSYNMFLVSTNLVGGAGTVYDSKNTNKAYARIDGGSSSPGYFTLKN